MSSDCEEDDHEEEFDESDDEDEADFYNPSPGDNIADLLSRRVPLGKKTHDTGMSTQQDWLRRWNVCMSIRELIQNFVDYVRFKTHKEVVITPVQAQQSWPDVWRDHVRQSRCIPVKELKSVDGMRFFKAEVNDGDMGHIATGRGMFLIVQHNSTLSMDNLYQRSTKQQNMTLAGTHGCGMKEGILALLIKNGRARMWMPAQATNAEKPGESWTWQLSRQAVMKVKGSTLSTYKSRALLVAITDLPRARDFSFDPSWFLFFNQGPSESLHVAVKQGEETLDYKILFDVHRLYNYGIFVQDHKLCKDLKLGLDGRFKLRDRYRTEVDNVERRFAAAIKVAVRQDPVKVMPRLLEYPRSIQWLFPFFSRPEDVQYNHRFRNLSQLLVFGISKWKGIEDDKTIVLAGPRWSQGERALASAVGLQVFRINDTVHAFEDKVLHPTMDKNKKPMTASALQDFFVNKCEVTGYTFYTWAVEGLEDRSALQPFYIRGKDIIITSGLVSDEALRLQIFSKLVTTEASPGLLEKALRALDKKPETLSLTDSDDDDRAASQSEWPSSGSSSSPSTSSFPSSSTPLDSSRGRVSTASTGGSNTKDLGALGKRPAEDDSSGGNRATKKRRTQELVDKLLDIAKELKPLV